ncbi:unnamed protein product [Staphylococcus haemolyticus JCSC1435]|uniref:Uncharacterized protein n=1 Tax=Staphylococcus haemolyticus (strain JCSC1435) TaxID=279808 RepID=Q4L8Y9_STAHJ|nr:unnamed protein product [Staphylococcus haemolyticus JCSC1435]
MQNVKPLQQVAFFINTDMTSIECNKKVSYD